LASKDVVWVSNGISIFTGLAGSNSIFKFEVLVGIASSNEFVKLEDGIGSWDGQLVNINNLSTTYSCILLLVDMGNHHTFISNVNIPTGLILNLLVDTCDDSLGVGVINNLVQLVSEFLGSDVTSNNFSNVFSWSQLYNLVLLSP
jgi:hypothetical protein